MPIRLEEHRRNIINYPQWPKPLLLTFRLSQLAAAAVQLLTTGANFTAAVRAGHHKISHSAVLRIAAMLMCTVLVLGSVGYELTFAHGDKLATLSAKRFYFLQLLKCFYVSFLFAGTAVFVLMAGKKGYGSLAAASLWPVVLFAAPFWAALYMPLF